ncbi:hypothetical protein TSOC_006526 [Tetrabaena socialis]|uniref:Uncharacterized protein n=1 Tax=Tetrabaena socialis TaxID=47790 RepID=A0A2J8A3C8_9CHLO|nr:hypothetical protein TSOC_006526 [Tetrabaena socialis]|eukprot:PNH07021.1 hypothetical protein TSOC_006526 [Tetrabaena socialis]
MDHQPACSGGGFRVFIRVFLSAFLLALLAAPANGDAPTNVSLPDLANSFWTPNGIKLPSRELVDAVRRAKLPVLDAFGHRREVVLMSIASEFAFQRLFDVFLTSLQNITFPSKDGSLDNLAKHLVINVMTTGSIERCAAIATKYGSACVSFANSAFSSGNFHVHSNDFYGIGFTKTATILDGLTLGVDVLFLDAGDMQRRRISPVEMHQGRCTAGASPLLDFASRLQGACGCDLRGVPFFHNGKLPPRMPDGTCEPALMSEWYNYHMPCAGDMNDKSRLMQEYADMYVRVVGPINSKSAPLHVL